MTAAPGPPDSLAPAPAPARSSRRARRNRNRKLRRVLVAVLILSSMAVGGVALVRSPLFEVDGIRIVGTQLLTRETVIAQSGLRVGMNVLSVDTESVRRRLETLPLVRKATVERLYPSKVRIRLIERVAAATARTPGGLWLIERSGLLIAPVSATPLGLSEVRVTATVGSPAMAEAMRLWSAMPDWARAKTTDIGASDPLLVTATIGGTRIIFGSADEVVPKMQAIVAIFERAKTDGRRVARIDVRAPRRPAAVFA